MDEQIRIDEKAHFYTETKYVVEKYASFKRKQGCDVRITPAKPKGWVVISHFWCTF